MMPIHVMRCAPAAAAGGVVACLLHFDGSGTSFVDETGKTCTAFGTAT
jgi:hypothetical protein